MLPKHPNLLRYYTSVIEGDRLHIVTEYLNGFNFAQLLPDPDGLFPNRQHPNSVLKWVAQLLDGLAHMHAAGLAHRDLHNENVMVLRDPSDTRRPSVGSDAVRIIDFGGGKAFGTASGPQLMSQLAGFAQYASPERRSGLAFDERDDVWAAGCHLLELATGKRICHRIGCGDDGCDFAISPSVIRTAIQECTGICCCGTALYYILDADRQRRPSAAKSRTFVTMLLKPVAPLEVFERPSKRLRTSSGRGMPRASARRSFSNEPQKREGDARSSGKATVQASRTSWAASPSMKLRKDPACIFCRKGCCKVHC